MLSFIRRHTANHLPTLVHCHAGRDRSGVILACYPSAEMGLGPAEAVARLRAVKPAALSAKGYEDLVYTLLPPATCGTSSDRLQGGRR